MMYLSCRRIIALKQINNILTQRVQFIKLVLYLQMTRMLDVFLVRCLWFTSCLTLCILFKNVFLEKLLVFSDSLPNNHKAKVENRDESFQGHFLVCFFFFFFPVLDLYYLDILCSALLLNDNR